MRRKTQVRAAVGALAAAAAFAVFEGAADVLAAQPPDDRRQPQRIDEALRREGEALLRLADAAMTGASLAADFPVAWRHDFLKAQPGTFVPFTVTVDRAHVTASSALLYVRAVRRGEGSAAKRPAQAGEFIRYPVDVVFPVDLAAAGQPIRISRGISMVPGEYELIVVLRERSTDPRLVAPRGPRAGVVRRTISVPDFWTGELTTSTIMLADGIDVLPAPLEGEALQERPYVIGRNALRIAHETSFRRDRELIVVFVIYSPTVADGHFDVRVDYQVYRRASAGERFVTRTEPQRFNPSVLGPGVDPSSGQPIMAGQGILLSSFEAGDYRLGITVTDLLSRRTLSRDVTFSVTGS